MKNIKTVLIFDSILRISIFENPTLEPPAGFTHVCVLVVFEEDITLELSAAHVHATSGDAKG